MGKTQQSGCAVSVLFFPSGDEEQDRRTLGGLHRQGREIQVIPVEPGEDPSGRAKAYNRALKQAAGRFVSVAGGGDRIPSGYYRRMLKKIHKLAGSRPVPVWMPHRQFLSFSLLQTPIFEEKSCRRDTIVSLDLNCRTWPVFLSGVLLDTATARRYPMTSALGWEAEKDMLLRLLLDNRLVGFVPTLTYGYAQPQDIHFDWFAGMFDPDWYIPSVRNFLLPLLKESQSRFGEIPLFLQCFCIYYIRCRLEANSNNRNKHVLDDGQVLAYRDALHEALAFLSDAAILNLPDVAICQSAPNVHQMLMQLKRNDWSMMYQPYLFKTLLLGTGETVAYSKDSMRVRMEFIDYRDGKWEIDGSVPALFSLDDVRLYVCRNDEEFDLTYNQRYSLTKYFGVSAFKRYTFHVSIPLLEDEVQQDIQFRLQAGGMTYPLSPEYSSHFSRLSGKLRFQYWRFGRFIAYHAGNRITIRRSRWWYTAYREIRSWGELLCSRSMLEKRVLLLRMLYFITRPWYRRRRIWLFYDKIYKGGDSSEYLFRYAKKQTDGIHKYYLLDPSCPDWKRMKREGYHPLRRHSIRHRMIFLNADMVIASNSTVFPFNGYSMGLSAYIRGIPDFHVVCVQHGMSVQKIAVAQNRLRDNTRLYFCASRYEIENLSHPVYDYQGYDALKLTGVPRYDGLVNEDKKQILISPTWRMQAARLVTKSESVQRDYNPLFKQTSYFKVYNSLINDERLIAAAKKYGYTIAYVLHPIISPQAEDFDTNEYVRIIPSTGDMSYEQMFRESSLMVTDFSGVQFDFAYMRKPLVYLHHHDIPQHYEEGTFHYDTMAFGEICHTNDELIDLLCGYMRDGCRMKEEYRRRADDFFAFRDRNNCQRIYDIMLDYQKEKIDPVRHHR